MTTGKVLKGLTAVVGRVSAGVHTVIMTTSLERSLALSLISPAELCQLISRASVFG
jgi:hypothetical protein